jgi:8-oxo-dGTP pyrophosphatase MutT (NUDIX family)
MSKQKIDRDRLPYREAVLGFVVDENSRFLVVTHASESIRNAWRFPGGGLEPGETPEEAILREFAEEFGADRYRFEIVRKSRLMNQTEWPDETILAAYRTKGKWWRGQRQHQFRLRCSGDRAEIRPKSTEIREMQWATIEELPTMFVFPGQWENAKRVIDELFRQNSAGTSND